MDVHHACNPFRLFKDFGWVARDGSAGSRSNASDIGGSRQIMPSRHYSGLTGTNMVCPLRLINKRLVLDDAPLSAATISAALRTG